MAKRLSLGLAAGCVVAMVVGHVWLLRVSLPGHIDVWIHSGGMECFSYGLGIQGVPNWATSLHVVRLHSTSRVPFEYSGGPFFRHLSTPLWIPTVGFVLAFLCLHYLRGGSKPGHCTCCGYDLTGNVSGVCSECGTPTEQDDEDPSQSAPPSDAAEAERRA